MTTAVEHLNRGHLDNAISWFQQAAAYGYPGAREVRNAVANLHDILRVTTTDRYRDDPLEQLILQPRLQASMNAVTHSLTRAARLALQRDPSASSEHTNTHPHCLQGERHE